MPLKLKSNTFQRKLKKPSLNTNQLKEFGKESNTCQSKPKSSTTQKGTTTLQAKVNTSRLVTLKEDMLQATNKEWPPTPHTVKVPQPTSKEDTQLKEVTPTPTFQELDKVELEEVSFKDQTLNTPPPPAQSIPLDKPTPPLDQLTQPVKPLTPLDKLTPLEEVESEEKMSTDNHKLAATSPVEVESDNDSLSVSLYNQFFHFN